jgi:DNA helicase MCM8
MISYKIISGGHYNRAKTVAENLKLSPALLSRFDLVFIMIDTPNEESDMFLSDHIMKRHRKTNSSNESYVQSNTRPESVLELDKNTLTTRLRPTPQEQPLDLIPHQLIKIYIAYARRYVFPRLLQEAADAIKTFYLELRLA